MVRAHSCNPNLSHRRCTRVRPSSAGRSPSWRRADFGVWRPCDLYAAPKAHVGAIEGEFDAMNDSQMTFARATRFQNTGAERPSCGCERRVAVNDLAQNSHFRGAAYDTAVRHCACVADVCSLQGIPRGTSNSDGDRLFHPGEALGHSSEEGSVSHRRLCDAASARCLRGLHATTVGPR